MIQSGHYFAHILTAHAIVACAKWWPGPVFSLVSWIEELDKSLGFVFQTRWLVKFPVSYFFDDFCLLFLMWLHKSLGPKPISSFWNAPHCPHSDGLLTSPCFSVSFGWRCCRSQSHWTHNLLIYGLQDWLLHTYCRFYNRLSHMADNAVGARDFEHIIYSCIECKLPFEYILYNLP